MITGVTHLTRYVRNEDEARDFYTEVLGFEVRADSPMGENRRWLTVGVPGQNFEVVVYNPHNWLEGEAQTKALEMIGHQPLMVLGTGDMDALVARLQTNNVTITRPIGQMPWGRDLTFLDLYGDEVYVVESTTPA
jgi:catechol 2,3-dioxygenase-like lactoylglutathione lyase family enzyme